MHQKRLSTIACLLSAGYCGTVLEAAVIYREIFPTTGSGLTLPAGGWDARVGPSAVTLGSLGGGNSAGLSNSTGRLNDLAPVASNPPAGLSSFSMGLFYNSASQMSSSFATASDRRAIYWTEEFEVDRSQWTPTTISVRVGNASALDEFSLAVHVGSEWYVSTQSVTSDTAVSSVGGFAGSASLETFNWTSLTWKPLTFTTQPAALSVGSSTVSLPPGDIVGFGLYTPQWRATQRFDTFTIEADAVPEPAALVTLVGAGLLLCRRRAR